MKRQVQHDHDIIITGIHLELTEALKAIARAKLMKLIRHEDRIDRIRLDLAYEPHRSHENPFTAKAHVTIGGPDMVCSVTSDDMHKSIDALVNKVDRMIRRRHRLNRVKRKQPHDVDVPALLPKVASAR